LKTARERGRQVACLNKLKQLTLAGMMYAGDYNDWVLPGQDQLDTVASVAFDRLYQYRYMQPASGILDCPSDNTRAKGTDYYPYAFTGGKNRSYVYAMNAGLRLASGVFQSPFWRLGALRLADRDLVLWCSDWVPAVPTGLVYGGSNYSYVIGDPTCPPLHGDVYDAAFMDGHVQRVTGNSFATELSGRGDWN
jgi:hypothetical protein